jgi:hypothetical protein
MAGALGFLDCRVGGGGYFGGKAERDVKEKAGLIGIAYRVVAQWEGFSPARKRV